MISDNLIQNRVGRPKCDTKHEAILQAASELFMDIGYARTSMDAIAQEAGVSKQTVYSHFQNKDDLFRSCIMAKVRAYGLDMQDAHPDLPLTTVLETIGRRLLDLLCDPGVVSIYKVLIGETKGFPQLSEAFWDNGPQATMDTLARCLAESRDPDYAPIDDPQRAAEEFLALVEGHYLMRLMMHSIEDIPEAEKTAHLDRCVTQFLRWHTN
ncbi:MAG: TetR/AcrR family transcriptional regulator [Pseudomonadota bacterium]